MRRDIKTSSHTDGHHVADGEVSLLSAVDELAGVHALGSDEQLLADLVAVGIAEVDDGERSATAGIVDDVPDDALDVAITFGVVDGSELGSALPALGARREDGSGTLTLGSNNTTHFSHKRKFRKEKGKGSRKGKQGRGNVPPISRLSSAV